MSTVNKGVGRQLARLGLGDEIGYNLADELVQVAKEVELRVVGFAAEHIDTGDFAHSIDTVFDRSSPSGKDVLVYSDDPNALSIEFGHDDVVDTKDGRKVVGHVEGLHIFSKAMNSMPADHA